MIGNLYLPILVGAAALVFGFCLKEISEKHSLKITLVAGLVFSSCMIYSLIGAILKY